MNNTRENVVKLLNAKSEHCSSLARMFKDQGKTELYNEYLTESIAMWEASRLLTDCNYFNEMYEIFKRKIEG